MDKDYVIYIILFCLISLGAYKNNVQKESLENRIKNTEDICISLTVKGKKMQQQIDLLQMKFDSVYLQKNK